MTQKKKIGLIFIIVPVFLLYFLSEAVLREAAVANNNPQKVKIDSILNELPESIRDLITYRITRTEMLNDLAAAETEEEKLAAMVSLGIYTRDPEEKEKILWDVRSHYADKPESAPAFAYYLLNEENPKKISIPEYQAYLRKFPQQYQFNIWALGLNRLNDLRKKITWKDRLDFLKPLLEMKPEFRDYSVLYTEISRIAGRFEFRDIEEKAEALYDESRLCPSITEFIMQEEMEKMNAAGKDKK